MKYKLLIFLLLFSFLNADYLVYEDKNNSVTLDYIKKNQNEIFTKTKRTSLGATKSIVWLKIDLNNDTNIQTNRYIRFREAFLYKIELFDENRVLIGGSSKEFKNRELPFVTDSFAIKLLSNSSKTVFIKITPKYNATYAYDIFNSFDELESHNNNFENVFIAYLSVMSLILISAIFIFTIFKERIFAYYIYFVLITILFQLFQSGYILLSMHIPDLVKYDEVLALALLLGGSLFLREFFKEALEKYTIFKWVFKGIFASTIFGIVLLLLNFSYYVDLLVELVIINFGLMSLVVFVLYMAIKRVKYSLFALVGIFVFINSSLFCALYYTGFINSSYALVVMQLGSIIEALAFLALILYGIYNRVLEEKIKSEKYATKLDDMQILAKMGTWTYDVGKNCFNIDKATKAIFETKEDAFSFDVFVNYIDLEDRNKLKNLKEQVLSSPSKSEYIFKIKTKNNNLKYISIYWQSYLNKKDEISFVDGYVLDITEKTLAQLELEKQHSLLMHQQKLAQQGEMLSMIAHQWRQPLTAVSATTNALLLKNMVENKIDSELLSKELGLISDYTKYLSSTIDDFRYFFKVEKEKSTCSLEELVEKSLNIINRSMESNKIEISKTYDCNRKINSYCNEIQQVILNLLKNAEDVLVERDIKKKKIFIETKFQDKQFLLSINDNAGGIKEEFLNKIFEPYFSTKKNKDGTGLGLYMSRTIIKEHCNGSISVKNNQYGAVFTIRLKVN